MKEPIFQPGAGWVALAMTLTTTARAAFHNFISVPVARVVVGVPLRGLLKSLGLL